MASRALVAAPDTLTYSWNKAAILRDTLSDLEQTGILRFFDTTINASITYGYVWDAQAHLYRTVAIGSQVWMAQNLNYKVDSSWCYESVLDSCNKYGRLYQWASAMDVGSSYDTTQLSPTLPAQGVCPSGWHVPSDAEWTKLTDTTLSRGMITPDEYGFALKSTTGWSSYNIPTNGGDICGFWGLPGGERLYDGSFGWVGSNAYFWSSSEYNAISAWYRNLNPANAVVRNNYPKIYGRSLRCLKN